MEALVGEDVAAAVDELAGGEVAVLRQDVVEVDLGPAVAGVVGEDDTDGPVAVLDQERVRAVVAAKPGLNRLMSFGADASTWPR